LHDTYGFSILEGFSVGTPAITTNVCALPEIIHPDKNGYLLHLQVNEYDEYNCWGPLYKRGGQEHWDFLDNTYNELAFQALNILIKIIDNPEDYEQISAGAIAQAHKVHNSQKTGERLDNLYSQIALTE
jgi:glycosyltransferase involved in cell wall biosynthesis